MTHTALSRERFERALGYIEEHGRPLEVARLRHWIADGPRERVLEELAHFQNEDGGFGRALEPDLRAPESSAICTAVAFQILRRIDGVRSAGLADRALDYLLGTLDRDLGSWRIVPETADASPHAPWWNQTGRDHGYDGFNLGPTAELLGYLYERGDEALRDDIELVTRSVTEHLASRDEVEMHDLLCCLRLFASPGVPPVLREALQPQLARFAARVVVRDPAKWKDYGLRPLQVADRPSSAFLAGLETEVEQNLDYLIETREQDGSWTPTWTWGDAYPDVWPTARREWTGVVTLENLRVLRRFGRIKGLSGASR